MAETNRIRDLHAMLTSFGDAREDNGWRDGDFDYVAALNITQDDVPQLIATMRKWIFDCDEWPEDENDVSGYAPIHAWRAAAQFGAVEAIEAFLEILNPMDDRGDDWYLEEFPQAFAFIGPAAIEPLAAFLDNGENLEYPRVCAMHSLQEVAARHPQCREQVVGILREQLRHFRLHSDTLNAFLVSYLLTLKATEAAEEIERAFAADCVELDVVGNWSEARAELGVEGLGLVPEALASARRSWVDKLSTRMNKPSINATLPRRSFKRRKRKNR